MSHVLLMLEGSEVEMSIFSTHWLMSSRTRVAETLTTTTENKRRINSLEDKINLL